MMTDTLVGRVTSNFLEALLVAEQLVLKESVAHKPQYHCDVS